MKTPLLPMFFLTGGSGTGKTTVSKQMHWMALVCDDDVLESRLHARPAWRGVTDAFVEAMLEFNAVLRSRRDIQRIDTTHLDVLETVACVYQWLQGA